MRKAAETRWHFLDSTADDVKDSGDKFKKLVDAWYAGDDERIDKTIGGEFRDKHPEEYQTLILNRNTNFTEKIDGLLKGEGSALSRSERATWSEPTVWWRS